jgi:transposase-like protein
MRFLVASKLSKHRDVGGAARVFTEAAKNAHDSEPERIFTDGLKAYSEGMTFAPFTKDPEHVPKAGIGKPHATNNRIERLNGTVRKRVKVQRGLKSMGSAIPEGNRLFYNFVRPHMALDEQTPAQVAGIDLKLDGNKWMELIRQATPKRKTD